MSSCGRRILIGFYLWTCDLLGLECLVVICLNTLLPIKSRSLHLHINLRVYCLGRLGNLLNFWWDRCRWLCKLSCLLFGIFAVNACLLLVGFQAVRTVSHLISVVFNHMHSLLLLSLFSSVEYSQSFHFQSLPRSRLLLWLKRRREFLHSRLYPRTFFVLADRAIVEVMAWNFALVIVPWLVFDVGYLVRWPNIWVWKIVGTLFLDECEGLADAVVESIFSLTETGNVAVLVACLKSGLLLR